MAVSTVAPARDAAQIAALLDLPEVQAMTATLDRLRWTGREGYGTRAMLGMCLVKSLYCIPVWTRVAALVRDHANLRDVLGCAPSEWACYRFARRLREHSEVLAASLDAMVARLRETVPGYGDAVAIDGSDLPAYANGQRRLFKDGPDRTTFSDPEASWGHRSAVATRKGGGYYGWKVHAAVCANTDLPVAWTVRTAKDAEKNEVAGLLDTAARRGVVPGVGILDRGYDGQPVYDLLAGRGIRPVIALTNSERVKRGEDKPPTCAHGTWTFAGADAANARTKWRCPTGECQPRSVWIKADRLHPLIPRSTDRYRALYRRRVAVERQFGRLKNEWAMLPLRVRGRDRVALHVDLTMLACLGTALARKNLAVAA